MHTVMLCWITSLCTLSCRYVRYGMFATSGPCSGTMVSDHDRAVVVGEGSCKFCLRAAWNALSMVERKNYFLYLSRNEHQQFRSLSQRTSQSSPLHFNFVARCTYSTSTPSTRFKDYFSLTSQCLAAKRLHQHCCFSRLVSLSIHRTRRTICNTITDPHTALHLYHPSL